MKDTLIFLPFFAIITPFFFFIGINYCKFYTRQIIFSSVFVFIIALTFSLAAFYLTSLIESELLCSGIIVSFSVLVYLLLFEDFLSFFLLKNFSFKIQKILFFLFLVVIGVTYWPFAYVLMILPLPFSFYDLFKSIKKSLACVSEKNSIKYPNFLRKPNIYFVLLESFQPAKVISDLYGFSNEDFEQKIRKLGFVHHSNFFANYSDTLSTLYALLTGKHHFYNNSVGNDDITQSARDVILGKVDNFVFEVLKNNGYSICFLDYEDYIHGNGDSLYINKTNLNVCQYNSLLFFLRPFFSLSARIRNLFLKKKMFKAGLESPTIALENFIKKAIGEDCSHFYLLHIGADHTESSQKWNALQSWPKEYERLVKKANIDIEKTLRIIEENDRDSLIILCGDHGACKLRNIFVGELTCAQNILKNGSSCTAVCNDYFAVYFATNDKHLSDILPKTLSHVNLFKYIFSSLSESSLDNSNLVSDDSYIHYNFTKVFKAIENGKILEEWKNIH